METRKKIRVDLSEKLGSSLLITAREAFTSGMHTVSLVCAVILIGVAILTVTLLRHVRPSGEVHAINSKNIPTASLEQTSD